MARCCLVLLSYNWTTARSTSLAWQRGGGGGGGGRWCQIEKNRLKGRGREELTKTDGRPPYSRTVIGFEYGCFCLCRGGGEGREGGGEAGGRGRDNTSYNQIYLVPLSTYMHSDEELSIGVSRAQILRVTYFPSIGEPHVLARKLHRLQGDVVVRHCLDAKLALLVTFTLKSKY